MIGIISDLLERWRDKHPSQPKEYVVKARKEAEEAKRKAEIAAAQYGLPIINGFREIEERMKVARR